MSRIRSALIVVAVSLIMCALMAGSPGAAAQETGEAWAQPAVEPTILVRGFRFEGNALVSDDELAGLLAPMVGRELTLVDLHTATLAIELHYQAQGYFLVEAVVPPQEIAGGVVEIRIVEGRYGRVILHNESRLRDSVARSYLRPIVPGQVVTAGPYQRATLLLAGIPGVEAEARFAPGSEVGTADLHVTLRDGAASSGSIAIRSPAASPRDASVIWSVTVNNFSGLADTLGVLFGAAGSSRNFAVSYTLPTGSGLSVGLEYKESRQEVRGAFAPLDLETRAQNVSVSLGYVLRRLPSAERTLDLTFEHVSAGRDILGLVTRDARQRFSAGVSGQSSVGQNGRVQYGLQGTLGIARPETGDGLVYSKLNGLYSYTVQLGPGTQISGSVDAQLALTDLDASERMELGGAGGVRAYAAGVPGDSGILGRLQASRILDWFPLPGLVQASGYIEGGSAWLLNPDPSAPSSRQRVGMGMRLTWTFPRAGALHLERAWPIGAPDAADGQGGFWVQLVLQY